MPQLPEFQPHFGVMPTDPIGASINPAAYGVVGDAVSNVAATAANALGDIAEKRKQAQDHTFALSTSMKDMQDFETYKQQLKLQMPEDYAGYTQALTKWADDRLQKNQQAAPSETAKQIYADQMGRYFTREAVDAKGEEFKNRATFYSNNVDDQIRQASDYQITNPNVDLAYSKIDALHTNISSLASSALGPELARKKTEMAQESIANSTLAGLYAQALKDPTNAVQYAKQGLAIAQGLDASSSRRPDEHKIASYLKPGQKAEQVDRFSRLLQEQSSTDAKELHNMVHDNMSGVLDGNPMDPALPKLLDKAVGDGTITKQERLRIDSGLVVNQLAGNVTNEMARVSFDKRAPLIESLGPAVERAKADRALRDPELIAAQGPNFLHAETDQMKEHLKSKAVALEQELKSDPVAYVNKYFPQSATLLKNRDSSPDAAKQYFVKLDALQEKMGVDSYNRALFSKDEIGRFANVINDPSKDEKLIAEQINAKRVQYGTYYAQKMFDQGVNDKIIDPKWKTVFQATNDFDTRMAVAAIKNGPDTQKAYLERQGNSEATLKNLKSEVATALEPYRNAVSAESYGGNREAAMNDVQNNILTQAMQLKNFDPNLSDRDAAIKAMSGFSRTYSVSQIGNSAFMMPRQYGGKTVDKELVEAYVRGHSDPKAWDSMNLMVPQPADPSAPQDAATKKDRFYMALSQTGRWVNNDKGGLWFQYVDKDRGPQYVLGKDGRPVTLDILNPPIDEFTQKARGGFFDRLYKKIAPTDESIQTTQSALETVGKGGAK